MIFNSIERVKSALNFTCPDRVPIWSFSSKSDVYTMFSLPSKNWRPGHNDNEEGLFPHGASDLIKYGLWKWDKPDWAKVPEYKDWFNLPREEIDEFGGIWLRKGINTMGHPGRPSLTDYDKFDEYFEKYTPNFDDKSRYSFAVQLSKERAKEKYRMCSLGTGPFHSASQLRGFDRMLLDQYRNKNELKRLLKHLTDCFIEHEKMWVKYNSNPHLFFLYYNLVEQKGPFFSPQLFKEFYEPVYKPLFETAHDLDCDFHLHCCGKIDPLISILKEWGLDSLELDSPRMTGYPDLNQFRGQLMMWGCINIQSIYTQGTPEQCEREVWHMIRNLGTPKGGFGAYFYPQVDHIQAPEENIKAFSEGLAKYGIYANIPMHWWSYPVVNDWKKDEVPPLPP
ncbi:MAG: uroporphyrinogen decarboxylase family protein [Promethearchaeota archaeon]|jgi:uroporphyrinogen-III decarboxylase